MEPTDPAYEVPSGLPPGSKARLSSPSFPLLFCPNRNQALLELGGGDLCSTLWHIWPGQVVGFRRVPSPPAGEKDCSAQLGGLCFRKSFPIFLPAQELEESAQARVVVGSAVSIRIGDHGFRTLGLGPCITRSLCFGKGFRSLCALRHP